MKTWTKAIRHQQKFEQDNIRVMPRTRAPEVKQKNKTARLCVKHRRVGKMFGEV